MREEKSGLATVTEKPVILVIHSRPRLRKRLVEQVEEWCAGSIEVIGIQLNELDTACRQPWFQRLVCVFFQPDFNQARIKAKVQGCNGRAGVEPLPEKHEFHQNLDEGIFHSLESEGKFEQQVEQSFFDWTPARVRLRLEGPHETVRAIRLRWFLLRHGIPYQWTTKEDGPDIAAKVGLGKEFNPTASNLYIELGLIKTPPRSDRKYDLVIVGAGPAGLSAAISASANAGLSTLVIGGEYPGGNAVMSINLIENYLGFPGGVTGTKLLKLAVAQAALLKVDIRPNWTAARLRKDPTHSRRYLIDVKTGNGGAVASAAMVLLACGRQPESIFNNPDSPEALSEQRFTASGEVQYGMEKCDAVTAVGKNIVIVGGGDSAGQAALLLNACGAELVTVAPKEVIMSYHLQAALHRNGGIEFKSPPLTVNKFIGNDDHLTHVELSSGEKIPAAKVFVLAGGKPATGWLNTEGENDPGDNFVNIQLDRGFIRTDAYLDPKGELMFATSAPGVFAAGDVRIKAHGRVGQAVGQGVAAVASMERYLKDTWQEILKDEESQAWVLRKLIHDAKEAAS
ncbi:NAD(P)/FAD-dependent oxidoreductase [Streptomyces sp. NPDC014870]|uniref:NAD(P)/FAD-dependent oxidoreductase n=1 Tax=Streptomyces sp. NPDC014870 TaxID=3364925 RepID=UPI0036FA0EAF